MTMYEYLISVLSNFAKERGLIFRHAPLDSERPDEWTFGLYAPDRTWIYSRTFDADITEQLQIHGKVYADYVIEDIRQRLLKKGVIKF